jgi:RNA polymerase sigma-70 factor, ECF subfamily
MTTQGAALQAGQDRSDRQLLEAFARGGDAMAFELLMTRYQAPLYGFIRRQVGAQGEAEDVFQETVLRILGSIRTCRDPDAFRSWAFGVAANICRHEGRKQLTRPQTPAGRLEEQPGWAPSPEAQAQSNQVGERIATALAGLQAHQREVFVLYQYSRLSYEEIALAVGAPVGTVKSRMNGALTALRSLLSSLAEAQP